MGVLNITKIQTKKLKPAKENVVLPPLIKPVNFSVEINCLKCGKDFFKRVHALADVQVAWQQTEHCPNCIGKKK